MTCIFESGIKSGFLTLAVAGMLMTGLLPSSAAAQYKDYTRQLLEQQKRIQQQQRQQNQRQRQRYTPPVNQSRQRYVPPVNKSRQRYNPNDPNYWKNLQRQRQLQQQRKQQAERQQLEQWRREQLQKQRRQQLRQQQRTRRPATRTTRPTARQPTPRKKAAGFDPKAAAEQWRRRQQQKSRGRTQPRSTGKPTGVTTNRARSQGRGATTGVTRRGGGGIEGEGIDDIRMKDVTRRKPAPSGPRTCGCRGGDILIYGAICHPAKGKTYMVGNFPWTPQCSEDAFRRATGTDGRRR